MQAQQLFKVEDSVVAITGAASGIGLGDAQVMAANGAKLALIDIDQEPLNVDLKSVAVHVGHLLFNSAQQSPQNLNLLRGKFRNQTRLPTL